MKSEGGLTRHSLLIYILNVIIGASQLYSHKKEE